MTANEALVLFELAGTPESYHAPLRYAHWFVALPVEQQMQARSHMFELWMRTRLRVLRPDNNPQEHWRWCWACAIEHATSGNDDNAP